jgi:uncharacterized protein
MPICRTRSADIDGRRRRLSALPVAPVAGMAGPDGPPPTLLPLDVSVQPASVPTSLRVRETCRYFGMASRPDRAILLNRTAVALAAGQILLLTGPSGSGKSTTLRCLARHLGDRAIWVDRLEPADASAAVVDEVSPGLSLPEAISLLTACGLGEPKLWLHRYGDLSAGEQFRARLAMAMGRAMFQPKAVLIVDEFCAVLHRRLALSMAFAVRKLVSRHGLCMIAAAAQEDLEADLQPDWLLRLDGRGRQSVATRRRFPVMRQVSFYRRLRIDPGKVGDYVAFESMHYRRRLGLGPVDKVFVLRHGVRGEPWGVIVYGYPPLSLRLRNRATRGVYHRNGRALNRDFRILRRLVIHPDVRGCGLARRLVTRTLRQVGTRYVECLAAMGAVSPLFERAGMVRLGLAGLPAVQRHRAEALGRLGVDPLAEDFESTLDRRPAARAIVAAAVSRWLQATTGRPLARISRMTTRRLAATYLQLMAAEPVYYLWSPDRRERRRLRRGQLARQNRCDRSAEGHGRASSVRVQRQEHACIHRRRGTREGDTLQAN